MDDSPTERAISSEPSCSNRRSPSEDVAEHTARKRQRTSRGGSRSRSVDAATDPGIVLDSMPRREEPHKAEAAEPPSTPTRLTSEPVEPTSRVTINLRTRPLESIPSSPPSPSTPSKMPNGGVDAETRISIESESDALSTIPPIETPSTSSSVVGSPQIELVSIEDDEDLGGRDPAVAIINDDAVYMDPLMTFPYFSDGETLIQTVGRLARFLQYEDVQTDEVFCKVRDWIDGVLNSHSHPPLFYELFARNRQFWLELPNLVWALSYRSRFFGEFLRKSTRSRTAFSEMLGQFARLTGKFLTMDARNLSMYTQNGSSDRVPELGSRVYLQALTFLLRKEESAHIGRNLEAHYSWDWDDDVVTMLDSFQTEGGDIPTLTRLVEGKLKMISNEPKIIEDLTDPSRLAHKLVIEATASLDEDAAHHFTVEDAQRKVLNGYEFFRIMSAGLEIIIDKHLTFLSADSAMVHLNGLSEMYSKALDFENTASRQIFQDYKERVSRIPPKYWKNVISLDWKFGVLKKLITSTQMQLRVIGVTTMCTDLLEAFTNIGMKGQNPSTIPYLRFFADFILRNQLVDYIVGIGSHPEIINESNNILGYLIATKTYDQTQTDKIWQTVTTSQDPRVVDAILRMLMRCHNLYNYSALTYLCQKVIKTPIESFTPTMRDFCTSLFKDLVAKSSLEGEQYLDPAPYELLVRLIKESSSIRSTRYSDVHSFATTRLRDLLQSGPAPESLNAISLDCIRDISAKNEGAPGSICIISILVKNGTAAHLHFLTTEHNLTQLLIEEIESAVSTADSPLDQSIRSSPAIQARRELLLSIMIHEPATISPELGKRLWDVLVGCNSKNVMERNISWQILNTAVKKTSCSNIFLAACFKDYLPTLPKQCLTQGALEFARAAVATWLDEVRIDFIAQDRSFESEPLEQIWRMILTAPPNTIDAAAISIIVEIFVNSTLILSIPRTKARTIHLALVNRCLRQLEAAATKLKAFGGESAGDSDGSMIIVASETEFHEQETTFARSLAVLREFLRAYQSKPQFSPPKSRIPVPLATNVVEGEPLTLKYQSFDGDKHTEVKSLTLGRLSTAASLFATLQKETGFKNYKVYCSGKEFDPDEVEVCKSLDDLKLNGLVLVQRREDADALPAHLTSSKPTIEAEITKHFDDLWSYLSMNERVAQEIYYFLKQFPVYGKVTEQLQGDTVHSELFPAGQPFRSLYAIHALREFIMEHSRKGITNETPLTRAISLIVAAISDQEVLLHCATTDIRDYLALEMVNCLVEFLREPLLPSLVGPCLDDVLLRRLLQLLQDARRSPTAQNSAQLTGRTFEAMLEASTHSPDFWVAFSQHLRTSLLVQELVYEDQRHNVRKSAIKQIVNKCTYSASLAQVSTTSFVLTFWPIMANLIPHATLDANRCEETFSLAVSLFKRLADTSLDFLNLEDLVKQWGALLLNHSCVESVGYLDSMDMVAHGLTHLLTCAASFAKASQQKLSCSAIGTALFQKHLFPELSLDPHDGTLIKPRLPLLNPSTRHTMADGITFLVKDDEMQYKAILSLLGGLVPYGATEDMPYVYDMAFQFDRLKAIRSPTGYVGLRNLSNTCYLNSLFTQLFMNIPFREFMLEANVADGGASQRLLYETQTLFSYMQNSLKKFVDPSALASSIRTYEETQIDVTIQMDVDEFYNLLFDRWESQILAEEEKVKFRSFYGGQLVQQVKSKECTHISERLEPFSAIQCDIKGKTCLQESLQAYVDGEIMEGDNKYKCSTCDLHVDAVKRACLKDLPDNLIFHLKRFDFNIQRMQRSKINDHFSFPAKIDMRPYTVEYLMNGPDEIPEDVFELVGILVHAGTAESGHYYSFIRERPSNSENETWVEFNDENVSSWDPANMENNCFGGPDYRGSLDNGTSHFDKTWSAYMLFYQRSSVVVAQKETLIKAGLSSPVRLNIPYQRANHITMENELFMRRYCLFDPSHAPFVVKMLGNLRQINGGSCGTLHAMEKHALTISLNHLDQVIARAKDLPDFMPFMLTLKQLCSSCAECSRDYLEWYCDCPETIRQLLLRNPESSVRAEIAHSILAALKMVNSEASYAYGFGDDDDSADELEGGDPQLIQRVIGALNKLWDMFHTNTRAWPEYFGLLSSIAQIGKREATLLLDAGYLRRTLEIVSADNLLQPSPQYQRMLAIISKRLSTRPVSYEAVIALLWRLLKTCDPNVDLVSDTEKRISFTLADQPVPFSFIERHLLAQHWNHNSGHVLVEKLLNINQNTWATDQIIIELLSWPEPMDSFIYNIITTSIRSPLPTSPCAPFLRAAALYCEHSMNPKALFTMTISVSKLTHNSDSGEGREFLHFFRRIYPLEKHHSDMSKEEQYRAFLDQIPTWAPCLLTNYDAMVRNATEDFLVEILPKPEDNPLETEDGSYNSDEVIAMCARRLGMACLEYLGEVYLRRNMQQPIRSHLMSVEKVITACATFFDPDPEDADTARFHELRDQIISSLQKIVVEEPDEEASEWDNSDPDYDESSEALDGMPDYSAEGVN